MSKSRRKIKLLLLYLAGYAYLFSLIIIILGSIAIGIFLILNQNSLEFKIFQPFSIYIILTVVIIGFFKELKVKIPAPEGIDAGKEEFPELYNILEEIRIKINCPEIHYVKFDLSFNAYVDEIPMYGVLGPFRRYLVIGIPLMLALSKDELRAVISHELGHLSRSHGKMHIKLLRIGNVWKKAYEEVKKSRKRTGSISKLFLARYIPALNNALFSLRRENEHAADKAAEIVAGTATVAAIIVKIPLYGSYIEGVFWYNINALARVEEAPPQNIFQLMEAFLEEPLPEERSKHILTQILQVQSLPCWTQPSASERLENIGVICEFPDHRKVSSLRDILGEKADTVLSKANGLWLSGVSETWSKIYKSCEESRQRLKQLEEGRNQVRTLAYGEEERVYDEEIERALLLEETEGIERGLEAFKTLYDAKPDDSSIGYHLGRLMIKTGEPGGQNILQRVMENDAQLIPHCCNVLYQFYLSKGRMDQAQQYYYHAVKFMEANKDIKKERNSVRCSQAFLPHDLDINTLEELRSKLLEKGYVKRAYVAIKAVEKSGQFPLYVILIKTSAALRAKAGKIRELAGIQLIPWEYLLVPIHGGKRELEYKFISLQNSRIV